jgi:hypothetical protein
MKQLQNADRDRDRGGGGYGGKLFDSWLVGLCFFDLTSFYFGIFQIAIVADTVVC